MPEANFKVRTQTALKSLFFYTSVVAITFVKILYLYLKFIIQAISDSDFFPHLLGLCGNSSANLPISSNVTYGNLPLTYTYEDWGGIKSIIYTESEEEVHTIGFEYE